MKWLKRNRLVVQLLFTVLAAASLCGISVVVIGDAIRGAESVVVGEANRTLTAALGELKMQLQYRESSDPSWLSLPGPAQDVSLHAITQTVLRSYPGVEGGFFSTDGEFPGYAFPTHDTGEVKTDVPSAERGIIAAIAKKSLGSSQPVHRVIRGQTDLVILAAIRSSRSTSVWAMKRLPGRAGSHFGRASLLGILIAAALIGIGATLATGISLARGVTQITNGLSSLEHNFHFRLPERPDELGAISRSINSMAEVRRKLEADLRREDRLRVAGRLAAGLAHEIRNPLNSIRLTVQLMEHRLNAGRLRAGDLQTVQTEVDRLSALLNDLLDLQRERPSSPSVQPVLPLLEHCMDLLGRQAAVQSVSISIDPANRNVRAAFDSHQLTQAMINLLLNALEASPDGGTVKIIISERDHQVIIEVRDSGPGLDLEQQEHLFEPFYTTKTGGTGLGLAVSRELIRSQGGELSYQGNMPGACFSMRIPKEVDNAISNGLDR